MAGITLKQIASDLKVSASTVSRALSDNYQIGTETKRKVLAYAKQNNYTANRFAQALRKGKTKSIGLVIPKLSNPLEAQLASAIAEGCQLEGYQLIVMQSNGSLEEENKCVASLVANGVDGLLILPDIFGLERSRLKAYDNQGVPIVVLANGDQETFCESLGFDNHELSYQMTKKLIEEGFNRIAMFNFRPNILVARQRLRGYIDALKDSGIDFNPRLLLFFDANDAHKTTDILNDFIKVNLKESNDIDAIICLTESLTIQTLEILKTLKLAPRLTGFSNCELGTCLSENVELMPQPANELGKAAFQRLFMMINNEASIV